MGGDYTRTRHVRKEIECREHQEKPSRYRRCHKPFVAGSLPSGIADCGSGSSAPLRDPAPAPGTYESSSQSIAERDGTLDWVHPAGGTGLRRSSLDPQRTGFGASSRRIFQSSGTWLAGPPVGHRRIGPIGFHWLAAFGKGMKLVGFACNFVVRIP